MMMTMTMMTMADGRLMDDDDDCWWWWLMMMMINDDDDNRWWCWLMMMLIDDDDDWWWWLMMMLIDDDDADADDWWWWWWWLMMMMIDDDADCWLMMMLMLVGCQSLPHAHRDWVCGMTSIQHGSSSLLLSVCRAGVLRAWNVSSCGLVGELQAHMAAVNCITSNNSRRMAFTGSAWVLMRGFHDNVRIP